MPHEPICIMTVRTCCKPFKDTSSQAWLPECWLRRDRTARTDSTVWIWAKHQASVREGQGEAKVTCQIAHSMLSHQVIYNKTEGTKSRNTGIERSVVSFQRLRNTEVIATLHMHYSIWIYSRCFQRFIFPTKEAEGRPEVEWRLLVSHWKRWPAIRLTGSGCEY